MLRIVTVTVLGVFVLLYAGLGRSPLSYIEAINRSISGRDFSSAFHGIIPFDSVVASATDASGDFVKDACLVVVVRLSADAPLDPPKQTRSPEGRFVIGGRWRETPERMKLASAPDLLQTCRHLIDEDTILFLDSALEQPGNFVIRDWRAGVMQLYAPKVRLAAYLSYGPAQP